MPLLEATINHPGGEVVTKVRNACMAKAGENWEVALLPLAQREKIRREEAAQKAVEAALRTQAATRQRAGSGRKRQKAPAGSSSQAATEMRDEEEATASAPAALPLGPGLPADIQLQLLGNMLLTQGGDEPFAD